MQCTYPDEHLTARFVVVGPRNCQAFREGAGVKIVLIRYIPPPKQPAGGYIACITH